MKEIFPQIPSFTEEQIDTSTFTGLRNKTIILLMLDTGIRIREAMDVTTAQVDLKDRHLRRVKGKNGKQSQSKCRRNYEDANPKGVAATLLLLSAMSAANRPQ